MPLEKLVGMSTVFKVPKCGLQGRTATLTGLTLKIEATMNFLMLEAVGENKPFPERTKEIRKIMYSIQRDSVEREYLGLNQQHHRHERQQRIVQALQDP